MPATRTSIAHHRRDRRETARREITIDLPHCPDMHRLMRRVAVIEAIARNDGEGVLQLTGQAEFDSSVYDEGDVACIGDTTCVDLLSHAQQCSAEASIFAGRLVRTIDAAIVEFLEG